MDFTLVGLWHEMGFTARGVVVVLLAMSLYSLSITGERLLAYRKGRRLSRMYIEALAPLVETAARLKDAVGLDQKFAGGPVATVVGSGISSTLSWQPATGSFTGGKYLVLRRRETAPWSTISTRTGRTIQQTLGFGSAYRYAIKTRTASGTVGQAAYGQYVEAALFQENSSLARYSGRWTTTSSSTARAGPCCARRAIPTREVWSAPCRAEGTGASACRRFRDWRPFRSTCRPSAPSFHAARVRTAYAAKTPISSSSLPPTVPVAGIRTNEDGSRHRRGKPVEALRDAPRPSGSARREPDSSPGAVPDPWRSSR